MPESSTGEERTEPATPRKRQQTREEGQVAVSREVTSAVVLLFAVLALSLLSPYMGRQLLLVLQQTLDDAGAAAPAHLGAREVVLENLRILAVILLPVFALMAAAGLAGNILQVGFLFSPKAFAPKLNRISPLSGFKRIFGWRGFAELLKGLLKLSVLGFVCYQMLRKESPRLASLPELEAELLMGSIGSLTISLLVRSLLVVLVMAVIDYAFQRWRHENDIRMTPTELKQEMKQYEGDPLIKARIRAIQRERARQRMMSRVPEADVVVTNPTEYAVAIRYDAGSMGAPEVLAKGRHAVARRIRAVAEENGIPIVEDKPLARALYAAAEVGDPIPENLYQAVAELLAYVYQMEGKMAGRGASLQPRPGNA